MTKHTKNKVKTDVSVIVARNVIRVFLVLWHQPFTYSRTKMLFNDFVDVLKIPDITVLTPIMGSREPNDPTITSAKLAAEIPGSVEVFALRRPASR